MKQEYQAINSFNGEYKKLSNFYPVVIYYIGRNFPTVEHAFVASKSKNDWMFHYKISQIPANQAGKAKRYGRKIKLRDDWELIKVPTMERFLIQKFSYQDFREFILSTGNAKLTEGNFWHDNFWGDCSCDKCSNIKGQNQLGKLLMKVRELVK